MRKFRERIINGFKCINPAGVAWHVTVNDIQVFTGNLTEVNQFTSKHAHLVG